MIEKRLEDHLTEFYHRQDLRPQKLTELRALSRDRRMSREKPTVHGPVVWSWPKVLLHGRLAAAVVLLLLGLFYLGRSSRPAPRGELTADVLAQSIGREVAMNHKKQLDLEFSGRDYAALEAQMSKLDFALATPSSPTTSQLHVVGARYCSIQGQLAAQIRLRDPAGLAYTLYETRLTNKLHAVAGEVKTEDVRIRLWSEKGLFYGLAVNEPQSE
jgi:hypothetical protein